MENKQNKNIRIINFNIIRDLCDVFEMRTRVYTLGLPTCRSSRFRQDNIPVFNTLNIVLIFCKSLSGREKIAILR